MTLGNLLVIWAACGLAAVQAQLCDQYDYDFSCPSTYGCSWAAPDPTAPNVTECQPVPGYGCAVPIGGLCSEMNCFGKPDIDQANSCTITGCDLGKASQGGCTLPDPFDPATCKEGCASYSNPPKGSCSGTWAKPPTTAPAPTAAPPPTTAPAPECDDSLDIGSCSSNAFATGCGGIDGLYIETPCSSKYDSLIEAYIGFTCWECDRLVGNNPNWTLPRMKWIVENKALFKNNLTAYNNAGDGLFVVSIQEIDLNSCVGPENDVMGADSSNITMVDAFNFLFNKHAYYVIKSDIPANRTVTSVIVSTPTTASNPTTAASAPTMASNPTTAANTPTTASAPSAPTMASNPTTAANTPTTASNPTTAANAPTSTASSPTTAAGATVTISISITYDAPLNETARQSQEDLLCATFAANASLTVAEVECTFVVSSARRLLVVTYILTVEVPEAAYTAEIGSYDVTSNPAVLQSLTAANGGVAPDVGSPVVTLPATTLTTEEIRAALCDCVNTEEDVTDCQDVADDLQIAQGSNTALDPAKFKTGPSCAVSAATTTELSAAVLCSGLFVFYA